MSENEMLEHYQEVFGIDALDEVQREVNKLNQQFEAMGYTSEELKNYKKLKNVLEQLKDLE
jgi:hypothetical protein